MSSAPLRPQMSQRSSTTSHSYYSQFPRVRESAVLLAHNAHTHTCTKHTTFSPRHPDHGKRACRHLRDARLRNAAREFSVYARISEIRSACRKRERFACDRRHDVCLRRHSIEAHTRVFLSSFPSRTSLFLTLRPPLDKHGAIIRTGEPEVLDHFLRS